jgi:hypothetical protein
MLNSDGEFSQVVLRKNFYITRSFEVDYTTQHYFFHELNSTLIHRFLAASASDNCELSFFPARQVSEKIFNESSKSTENALIE